MKGSEISVKRGCMLVLFVCMCFVLWFVTFFTCQPMCCVLTVAPFVLIPARLLRHCPRWSLWLVACFLLVGMYVRYYDGSVLGEMEWRIRDMPINYPSQWQYSYSFYRWMTYLMDVVVFAGTAATLLALGYLGVIRLRKMISA